MWSWLERQPYVTRGVGGLYPHDLVRDVLTADLSCRSPATYRHVHGLVHRHAIAAIRRPEGRELGIHQRFYLFRNGHPDTDGPPPPELLRPPPLDQAGFADAVRAALRDLHRPDRLGTSVLMGTALAVSAQGPSVDCLRGTLLGAIGQVGRESRSEVPGRVLERTFVRAAPTQEAAAEILDMPLSTYRRHLSRAVERLVDLLWAVEIGEVRLDARLGSGIE